MKSLNINYEHFKLLPIQLSSVGSFIFDGIAATDLDGKNLYMQYEVVKGPYSVSDGKAIQIHQLKILK